jgi:hypothetical protein
MAGLPKYAFDKEKVSSRNVSDNIVYGCINLEKNCVAGLSERIFCSRDQRKKVLVRNLLVSFELNMDNACILSQMSANEDKKIRFFSSIPCGTSFKYLANYNFKMNGWCTHNGTTKEDSIDNYLKDISVTDLNRYNYCRSKKFIC